MTPYYDIEKFLSETFGFDPESIGRKNIKDAVNLRMNISMTDRVSNYLKLLKSDSEEPERLVEHIVVPETWFFRDRESFNFLRKHIDEIRSLVQQRKMLRILSAPCSTGEEPYSAAMVLLEAGLSSEHFRIDAVDISRNAIETAKRAVYGKGSFRGENRGYQDRYFTYTEEGFKLDHTVAGSVHFFHDNFIQSYALKHHEPYHVVFCKNLLIYLTDDARKMVFANLDRLLLPDGIVFTGHSEMMSFLQYGFNPVKHSRSFACRKHIKADKIESGKVSPVSTTSIVSPAKTAHGSLRGRKDRIPVPGNGSPTHPAPESVLTRVRILADRGALEEALKLCGQFLKEHSDNKEAYYLMGLINLALDFFTKAEHFFQKALYLDPCYYEALLHMNLLYEKRGELTKASVIKERIRRAESER
jgi:chemotaxis protein methyltransferase WspC